MKLLRRRRSLTCQRAVELATNYLDGALTAPERRAFEDHLKDCPHCAEYLRQIRIAIEATGHVDSDEFPAATRDTLITLYRNTVCEPKTDDPS